MRRSAVIALLFCSIAMQAFAGSYEVGPGKQFAHPDEVPWENLMPGDTVRIFWQPEAYRSKWVICRKGTAADPIVVQGIPNQNGDLPVLDGRDATTRTQLNFWNEQRGIIKIGGANSPEDTMPEYIIIEGLEIRGGRPPYTFTGRNGLTEYVNNCAAVYVEKGEHLILRNCILHDCGNGIFAGNLSTDMVVEHCTIYDNGIEGRFYEHNNYTEVYGILFQFNHFMGLREGCDGNNLKDRSAGTIIRYNWIEDGNRQLDLVDSGSPDFISDPLYRKSYVYGNILVESDGQGNSQIMHYGGDSGDEANYRKGTLYFHNNTVISTRSGNTTLVRLPSDDEHCDARNNILYTTAEGSRFAIISSEGGVIDLRNNFIKPGWRECHGITAGTVNDLGNVIADDPGFVDFASQDFHLTEQSPCIDAGTSLTDEIAADFSPEFEYIRHALAAPRVNDGLIDIGAYEYKSPVSVKWPTVPESMTLEIFPNPASGTVYIRTSEAQTIGVYSLLGEKVATIKSGATNESYVYQWRPDAAVQPGYYYVRVTDGTGSHVKAIQLIR